MPIIVESPSNRTVSAGETTWFVCKVSSVEDSEIIWLNHHSVHPSNINTSNIDPFIIVSSYIPSFYSQATNIFNYSIIHSTLKIQESKNNFLTNTKRF